MDKAERENLHDDTFMNISWDDKGKYMEMKTKASSVVGQELRTSGLRLVELAKRKGAGKILVDAAHLEKMSNEDVVWLEKELIPGLVKAGVKCIALVPPKALAGYLSFEKLDADMPKASGGIDRKFFSDAEQARKWLSHQ